MVERAELDVGGFAFDEDGAASAGAVLVDVGDGEAEDGADVEGELAQVLGNESDQAGVMGAGGDFTEDDVVAFDEHFDAEEAATAEGFGDGAGHVFGGIECFFGHGVRLPGLAIVAFNLGVTDGGAKCGAADVANGEHGDLVVEFDEAFDDDLAFAGATAFLGVLPGVGDVVGGFDDALALAGAAHDGLHDAGHADFFNGGAELLLGGGKDVGGGFEAELFGGEAADAFAVHGELGGAGGGDDAEAFVFEFEEGVRGDGLDFRDDAVGFFHFDEAAQGLAIKHGDDVAAVSDLHGGGIGVAVHGDDFAAEALEFDDDFFAELAGAEEHDFGCGGGKRGADAGHEFI